jgi:predicted nucleic acid-binding protein
VIVVSDTNMLSSLAAGDSFPALTRLFQDKLAIPPCVQHELHRGFDRGNAYLQPVLDAISTGRVAVLPLSAEEELLTFTYPSSLDEGEREALALAQIRKATLLSNDKAAQRYCHQRGVRVLNLPDVLRALWVEQVLLPNEVRSLISKMAEVERLSLTPKQMAEIFAAPEI